MPAVLNERAVRHRPGDQVVYDFVRDGAVEHRTFALRQLGTGEFAAILGAYLITGLAYLAMASVAGALARAGANS